MNFYSIYWQNVAYKKHCSYLYWFL